MNWIRNTFEISHASHGAIRPMEGIRGFAVFLVFLVHYVTLIEPWLIEGSVTYVIAKSIRSIGNSGVDLFFVLSGYLIYGMLIKKHTAFKTYILRRVRRIYPTFTVVFVIYLILSFIFLAESKIPNEWLGGAIFIIQNYLLMPGLFDVTPIITVAWSLSYEFFYYLIIPFLIASLRMRVWHRQYRVLFFALLSLFFFWYFHMYGGPVRLLMFVSGIILFEFVEGDFLRKVPPVGLFALLLALALIAASEIFHINGSVKYIFTYILFFIFCLECFSGAGFVVALFSMSYLRWFGNMSYSYYLIHGLALKAVFMGLNKIFPASHDNYAMFWLFILPVFFLTLLPSVMLFSLVEKPLSLQKR